MVINPPNLLGCVFYYETVYVVSTGILPVAVRARGGALDRETTPFRWWFPWWGINHYRSTPEKTFHPKHLQYTPD